MIDNKHRPPRIDGFYPRSNKPQPIGFEKPFRTRPDILPPKKQPQSFPGLGMTLPTYGPSAATQPLPWLERPKKVSRFKRLRSKFTWKRFGLVLLVLVLLGGGWLGFKFIYNSSKIFKGNIFGLFSTTKLDGEDTGRVNILLAGNSADDVGHEGGTLTDSIMVISIDTKDNTAFMMSIPRDFWVDIPGYGHAKINEAYPDGEAENFKKTDYFPGGMGLLQEVVQQNLGLTLNYYALVNYNAFRDTVNAVGGIDVNIRSSDPRGLYDPNIDYTTHGPLVNLTNGEHHLDGEQALDLARARGDSYYSYGFPMSDFNRTQNQRMMLVALKSKALSSGVLANPIKLSNLFDALGKNIKTDFTLSEVHRLYDLSKNIGNSQIKSVGLNDANGTNLLTSYTSPNGESALAPAAGVDDFTDIQVYLRQLTSNDPIVKEAASVVVLNATNTYGLAAKDAQTLTNKGIRVITKADASSLQATTTIIDNSKGRKPATKAYLQKLYGTTATTVNSYAGTYDSDFIIILGQDQAGP
jgi:LCP family protein required for cell wall assembly